MRTKAYDQNLDPNRPGEPVEGWDHILVTDKQTGESWNFDSACGNQDVPVPAAVEARRTRYLGAQPKGKLG
jgi:hypothetical protein